MVSVNMKSNTMNVVFVTISIDYVDNRFTYFYFY